MVWADSDVCLTREWESVEVKVERRVGCMADVPPIHGLVLIR